MRRPREIRYAGAATSMGSQDSKAAVRHSFEPQGFNRVDACSFASWEISG